MGEYAQCRMGIEETSINRRLYKALSPTDRPDALRFTDLLDKMYYISVGTIDRLTTQSIIRVRDLSHVRETCNLPLTFYS